MTDVRGTTADGSGRADDAARAVEGMIDDLAASSVELTKLLHETVSTLTEILAARGVTARDGDDGARDPGPLAPDVLEIATLQAQAAGVSVEDYVRAAVLAYAAHTDGDRSGGGDGDEARRRGVRDDARRLRAENQALMAEGARAAARAVQFDARSKASRQPSDGSSAKRSGDR
jgi:hypothetical protein